MKSMNWKIELFFFFPFEKLDHNLYHSLKMNSFTMILFFSIFFYSIIFYEVRFYCRKKDFNPELRK
jgi:hypothetical protein